MLVFKLKIVLRESGTLTFFFSCQQQALKYVKFRHHTLFSFLNFVFQSFWTSCRNLSGISTLTSVREEEQRHRWWWTEARTAPEELQYQTQFVVSLHYKVEQASKRDWPGCKRQRLVFPAISPGQLFQVASKVMLSNRQHGSAKKLLNTSTNQSNNWLFLPQTRNQTSASNEA